MDKYKELFEKGSKAYIAALERINWFDNLYVDKENIVTQIEACTFPPYFATHLSQMVFAVEFIGEELFEDCFNEVVKFLPGSSYNLQREENCLHVCVSLKSGEYKTSIDLQDFDFADFDNFFCDFINQLSNAENSEYRFYELPPDDESAQYIYVKPEVYKQALDLGIIPDFMGYFAVNY
jgi:hypothetical protein